MQELFKGKTELFGHDIPNLILLGAPVLGILTYGGIIGKKKYRRYRTRRYSRRRR